LIILEEYAEKGLNILEEAINDVETGRFSRVSP
jgi:hypothetical protein